jgi:hypothetical protein
LEEVGEFVGGGKIDSIIYTINGRWHAIGDWSLNVSDDEVSNFTTTMAWYNGTSGHTHEFLNFESVDDGGVMINPEEQEITMSGTMDVGTNGIVTWPGVPAEIVIAGAEVVTVTPGDSETDEHFSGQSVHGNVTALTICSPTPGPAMQVFTGC